MARRNHQTRAVLQALCEAVESRTLLSVARPSYNTGTGFFVSNGNVYDANGNEFVMKGVNAIHAWGSYNSNYATIDQVAKTGANAVRIVTYDDISTDSTNPYTDAADTPARRKAVVERYLANGIVAVIEDHASITDGNDANNPAALAEVTTHWLDNASWLTQYQSGVILNIANEWGPIAGKTGTSTVWRDSYITQVGRLRAGPDGVVGTSDDINNLLEIDAAGYGGDYNSLALQAQQILDADPQHNIVFSIHLYGGFRDESRPYEVSGGASDYGPWDILSKLSTLRNRAQPLPLVIGEFAWEDFRDFSNSGAPYASYRTQRVLQIADQLDIGWTGWSYNQSSPLTLNMLAGSLNNTAYNANSDLSDWGDELINDPVYGLKASAKRATVFPILGLPAAPAGLPALPASPPPATKFVLDTTRPSIAEGGTGVIRVKLSAAPTTNVSVTLAKASGDSNLTLDANALTFTPDNWNQYQSIFVSDSADADSVSGTAKFTLAAAGIASNDFTAREIDANLPTGTATLLPTADRLYTGSGTASSVTITSVTSPQPTGALFLKFDASGLGGKATSATLRIFKTAATSNLTLRLYLALTDSWTESGTTGINASYPIATTVAPNAANSYVTFDVTSTVASELNRDGIITFALTTASGSTTVLTREGASPPQLIVTTAEAVPPKIVSSRFQYETAINQLLFSFSEDVSASLAGVSLSVEAIDDPNYSFTLSSPAYNPATNTAAFAVTPGFPLPNGHYVATLVPAGITDAVGNALLTGTSLPFFILPGDINRDEAVNFDDLLVLAQNYGQSGRTFAQGDLTGDGSVDFDDLLLLAQNYGTSLPALIAPPAAIVVRKSERRRPTITL